MQTALPGVIPATSFDLGDNATPDGVHPVLTKVNVALCRSRSCTSAFLPAGRTTIQTHMQRHTRIVGCLRESQATGTKLCVRLSLVLISRPGMPLSCLSCIPAMTSSWQRITTTACAYANCLQTAVDACLCCVCVIFSFVRL